MPKYALGKHTLRGILQHSPYPSILTNSCWIWGLKHEKQDTENNLKAGLFSGQEREGLQESSGKGAGTKVGPCCAKADFQLCSHQGVTAQSFWTGPGVLGTASPSQTVRNNDSNQLWSNRPCKHLGVLIDADGNTHSRRNYFRNLRNGQKSW